jgi:hypothetical protein
MALTSNNQVVHEKKNIRKAQSTDAISYAYRTVLR